MTLGFDDATAVLLAASVEQQLNAGTPLTAPDVANQLLEVVPYWGERGAFTADEGILPFMRIQSDDIAITPKSFSMPGNHGGTAAEVSNVNAPPLVAMPMNVNLSRTKSARINYFANDQTDATIEPAVGCTVVYETNPPTAQEQFYAKAANEFTGGTVQSSRTTSVAALTITGGRMINMWIIQVLQTAAVASEHVWGFVEYSSSDFLTSMPQRMAFAPTAVAVGAAGDLASCDTSNTGGLKIYKLGNSGVPIAPRCVIDFAITIQDAVAAGANVTMGVGFLK